MPPYFLNGLGVCGEPYVVAVRANFSVVLSQQVIARIKCAEAVLTHVFRWQWRIPHCHEGSPGWLRARFVSVRCWHIDEAGTPYVGSLIAQWSPRSSEEWKYF